MSDDSSFQQRAAQLIKQIQVKIAQKSLKGAKQLLKGPYAQTLIESQKRKWLLDQVQKAEIKAKQSFEKRIYWEWWIIFLITVVVAGIVIYKFGVVSWILEQLKVTAVAARVIIRVAVYSITTLVGGTFAYLANCFDTFCTWAFGY